MTTLAAPPDPSTGTRWQPYPQYKASSADWLGEIPQHWVARRLKFVAPASNAKLDNKPDELPYLGLEHIESKTGRLLLENVVETVESTVGVFQRGQVLFGKLRPYLAKVVYADFDGVCTTELLALQPGRNIDGRFIFYQLLSDGFIRLVNSLTYGVKMPRVSREQIGELAVAVPSHPEQRAIAAFLDRETARIDALLAKRERLIALLEEKRTALISQTVIRGLDPSVPLRDSGIAWLGEVPAHWEMRRLKLLSHSVTSGSRGWAQHYSDDGALFLRIGNLTRTSIGLDLSDIQQVNPPQGTEGTRTHVQAGDVLISITAYIGSVAVVPHSIGEAYVSQHIALTRTNQGIVDPRWLGYCLLSSVGQNQFRLLMYGGTKEGLGLDDVRNLLVLLPPVPEQKAVADHIDHETAKIDAIIAKTREQIGKLQEYRTALISAAVTGKIDVRRESFEG